MEYRVRREVIQKLVAEHTIRSQQELIKLVNEHGFQVTQATVSRDLEALNIVKVRGVKGGSYYAQLQLQTDGERERLAKMIQQRVESVATVEFMNVVKTTPNSNFATIVAGEFDSETNDLIVGTLAGNDTLIIISPDAAAAKTVADFIRKHLA